MGISTTSKLLFATGVAAAFVPSFIDQKRQDETGKTQHWGSMASLAGWGLLISGAASSQVPALRFATPLGFGAVLGNVAGDLLAHAVSDERGGVVTVQLPRASDGVAQMVGPPGMVPGLSASTAVIDGVREVPVPVLDAEALDRGWQPGGEDGMSQGAYGAGSIDPGIVASLPDFNGDPGIVAPMEDFAGDPGFAVPYPTGAPVDVTVG